MFVIVGIQLGFASFGVPSEGNEKMSARGITMGTGSHPAPESDISVMNIFRSDMSMFWKGLKSAVHSMKTSFLCIRPKMCIEKYSPERKHKDEKKNYIYKKKIRTDDDVVVGDSVSITKDAEI